MNQGGFLARCIASVRDQPRGVAEHIVMDGGSDDGTADVLRAGFTGAWRSAPDGGQSHAINMAMGVGGASDVPRAGGAFGTWLNADDWFQPGALGPVAAYLDDHPETDVLICCARFVAEDGRVVFEPRAPERIDEATLLSLRSVWFAGHSIAQPEVFFRLSLFREVGGLDESNHHSMDHHLWLKFLEAGARFRRLDVHVANQGVHHGQKTADRLASTRCIVRSSRAWLDRRGSHWPLRAREVAAEIEAIESKLALASRYAGVIDGAFGEPEVRGSGDGGGPSASSVPSDWRDGLRRLLDGDSIRERVVGARAAVIGPKGIREEIAGLLTERGIRWSSMHERIEAFAGSGDAPDVVVAHGVLTGERDPLAALRAIVEGAGRGALVLLAAEVLRSELHDRYLRRLRTRAVNKVTEPDMHVIGPRADLALRPLLAMDGPNAMEVHPNPRGVDVAGLCERLGWRIDASVGFGRFDSLPLAPFPTVPKLAPHGAQGEHAHAWGGCAIRCVRSGGS